MEFAIGVAIVVIITGLLKIGKSHNSKQALTGTRDERRQQETDEIITVILPTINNDK